MESPGVDPARARWHHVLRSLLPEGEPEMALQERSPRQSRGFIGSHPMQDRRRPSDHHRDGGDQGIDRGGAQRDRRCDLEGMPDTRQPQALLDRFHDHVLAAILRY
jgi:hypothetical protein